MTFAEYNRLCSRTRSGEPLEFRDHCIQGIIEEVGEISGALKRHFYYKQNLDKDHIWEEVGDLCWYVVGLFSTLSGPGKRDWEKLVESMLVVKVTYTDELALYKGRYPLYRIVKEYMPGIITSVRDEDEGMRCCMGILSELSILVQHVDSEMTLTKVLELNIEKLKKRYPGEGFTFEHAELRLDKQDDK